LVTFVLLLTNEVFKCYIQKERFTAKYVEHSNGTDTPQNVFPVANKMLFVDYGVLYSFCVPNWCKWIARSIIGK